MKVLDPTLIQSDDELKAVVGISYGKMPLLLSYKNMADRPSANEVFASLQRAASDYISSPVSTIPFRAWCGNAAVLCDLAAVLPNGSDVDVNSYVERILSCADAARSFSLMLNHLHMWDGTICAKLAPFVRMVIRLFGLPPGGVDFDVIAGKYCTTGFGVHLDDADNFTFVLHGRKRIYAWPAEFDNVFKRRTSNIGSHMANAYLMDAGPGDIIYWPKSFWHVGESLETSLTFQVAFYGTDTLRESIFKGILNGLRNDPVINNLVGEHMRVGIIKRELNVEPISFEKGDPMIPVITDESRPLLQQWLSTITARQCNGLGTIGVNFASEA